MLVCMYCSVCVLYTPLRLCCPHCTEDSSEEMCWSAEEEAIPDSDQEKEGLFPFHV